MARELRATVARSWAAAGANNVKSCAEELGWGPSQLVLEGEWSGEPEDEVSREVGRQITSRQLSAALMA